MAWRGVKILNRTPNRAPVARSGSFASQHSDEVPVGWVDPSRPCPAETELSQGAARHADLFGAGESAQAASRW